MSIIQFVDVFSLKIKCVSLKKKLVAEWHKKPKLIVKIRMRRKIISMPRKFISLST